MSGWKKQSLVFLVTAALVLSLSAPSALAMDQVDDIDGTAGAMIFDLVLARPLGIAATVVGWTTFIASLPFTALGGNVGEAAQKLVVAPAVFTFGRPLGRFETRNR
jgi:hypothetical protein